MSEALPGAERDGGPYPCPCCGYKTLTVRKVHEICFWQDDGQGDEDADTIRDGPNHDLSLTQARNNFKEFGASSLRRREYARPPLPSEGS